MMDGWTRESAIGREKAEQFGVVKVFQAMWYCRKIFKRKRDHDVKSEVFSIRLLERLSKEESHCVVYYRLVTIAR